MFKSGQYIYYANSGLCKVEEVTHLKVSGADRNRLYYRLTPMNSQGGTIYTPVDNQKVPMREILNEKQAEELIDSIPQIEELWIPEEKQREQSYKTALQSSDCRSWIRIIKTLYLRKQSRISQGRKITSTDERYLSSAEEKLYGELAVALGRKKSEMEQYIALRIKDLEA
ncbi:MAG: CarD family transcriptional regulator [Lachnospiraceae bacterium]|nr:CarD family transcriptional regulator [Lachnospiraceae bacterium]MDD3797207.1 CarD family transcriptional regulator [Lachnospiraceae bacterium]